MKRFIGIIIAVVVGFAAGWYFGYSRPVAQNQRKILKEYEVVRDMFGYTDAEMTHAAETFPKPQEILASMAREDEILAAVGMRIVKLLDKGDVETAKQRLTHMLGTYYRVHSSNELYTNIISQIQKAAMESPSIAAEIAKKAE